MTSARFITAILLSLAGLATILLAQGQTSVSVVPQLAAATETAEVSFVGRYNYSSGAYSANAVAVADLNGDGKLDMVVSNACQPGCHSTGGAVSVLLGNGDGTFQSALVYDLTNITPQSVAIADVNGDGRPDLVVAGLCENENTCSFPYPETVSILLGNGDGTFEPAVNYNVGGCGNGALYPEMDVVVGDMNGDGKPDIVVSDFNQPIGGGCARGDNPGAVSVLLGNGDGTFQAPTVYSSGGLDATSVATGDVNGDGKLDLVVSNFCPTGGCVAIGGGDGPAAVSILLGNGDGTFQAPVSYTTGTINAFSVAMADVNGDGKLDLVVANETIIDSEYYGVSVLLGNGDGTFQNPIPIGLNTSPDFVAVGDLNGDGHPDIVVSEAGCKLCDVGVFPGNGDGTFQPAVYFKSGGFYAGTVAIGDVNGDGRPDLVVANQSSNLAGKPGTVGVLLNSLRSASTTTITCSTNPSSVNQAVTFTATVKATPQVQDGTTITFSTGKTILGTGTTTNGVATLTTSFAAAKTYKVVATFAGSAFHDKSSGSVTQVVNP